MAVQTRGLKDSQTRSLFSDVFSVLPDGVTILTFFLLLLLVIPSNRSIEALGSAGAVAIVWGCAGALWWLWYQLQRPGADGEWRARPVRRIAFALVGAFLLSYIAAMIRPLPGDEVHPADTGLIRLVGLVGILLVASDGTPDLSRFMTFLRRLSGMGGLYAAFGLFQLLTGRAWVDLVNIPGLITASGYESISTRGGLIRPLSTATHPLEYALALSMLLPIALSLAFYDKKKPFLVRWASPALMALALVTSSSRSAYVGLVVGLVVLFPMLSGPARWALATGAAGMLGLTYVIAPRVITNVRYLFLSVGVDDSAGSRTGSYDLVSDLAAHSPVVGRGFGTFLPEYRILDNQLLQLLIEVGVLGLGVFLLLLASAALCAMMARHRTQDPLLRAVGAGLVASVLAGASLLALFDAFSFVQAAGILFLVLGLCSAYFRLITIP
jgi:polysaccharide biosynthesis protein PslJ